MNEDNKNNQLEGASESIFENLINADLSILTPDKLMQIYNKALNVVEEKNKKENEKKNKLKELEEKYKGIRVAIGVPWVSVDIINDFVNELLQLQDYTKDCVRNAEKLGKWEVMYKGGFVNSRNKYTYGTKRYTALRIIDSILNMREIIVKDGSFINEEETIAATEKQKLIIEKFNEWVWQSDERKYDILTTYDKMFSSVKINNGNNINLEFKGKSNDVEIYDYQKSAIKRIIANKNTLISYEVGTGKTYIMIAAAMEMRAKGISKKNMFVVPNNIVSQWEKMFLNLYPKAKVLVVEPKKFVPNKRKNILEDIRDNDYDGIIIAYSCFTQINVSLESQTLLLTDRLEKFNQENHLLGHLFEEKEKLIHKINGIICSYKKENTPTFDELKINSLFVDEAHNFKNVPIETYIHNVRGINPIGSEKCKDMLIKVRIVQSQNNGGGVIFATGTPLSNSISDAYIMQYYLQIDRLEKCGLHLFDNWAKTFAEVESNIEVAVDSNSFRIARRFTKFFNLPELSKIFAEIAIFHSNEQCDLPDCKFVDCQIESSCEFKQYMQIICARAAKVKKGLVRASIDNMLKISTDGRKSALDLELVDMQQPYNYTSKVFQCVNNVLEVYSNFPDSSQIVFCDYSTPKNEGFSVYSKLKDKLIERGIKENEIAFIHNAQSESAKQKLFQDVNCGKIRVLIGSTFKLGIGANVQTKLKAIHHLDVPWRPADMVQREGRILRQGNSNKEVFIYRYILEGSFDAYNWQILETKQAFISQFLSNAALEREMSDLEENVLNYAEVKALALSQPLMKVLIAKENELKTAKIVQLKNIESVQSLKEKIELNEILISKLTKQIENCHTISAEIKKYNIKQIKQILLENVDYLSIGKICIEPGVELFKVYNFSIVAPVNFNEKKPILTIVKDEIEFEIEIGDKPKGNIIRIAHFFSMFEEYIEKKKAKLQMCKQEQLQMSEQIKNIDISDIKIKKLILERDEILKKINQ